jgi:hypothetical protein
MAYQLVTGVPSGWRDDGAMFSFQIGGPPVAVTCGFMHRPIDTPAPTGGTVIPPVKWTAYHSLDSWVETVKYSHRNNAPINVAYEDAILYLYNSWLAKLNDGEQTSLAFSFHQVYEIGTG